MANPEDTVNGVPNGGDDTNGEKNVGKFKRFRRWLRSKWEDIKDNPIVLAVGTVAGAGMTLGVQAGIKHFRKNREEPDLYIEGTADEEYTSDEGEEYTSDEDEDE